jgi:hypothetical protein
VNPETDWSDVDPALRRAVILTSMDLRRDFYIFAGKEGGHSIEGRHADGGAVDISRIDGEKFSLMNDEAARDMGGQIAAGIANRLPFGRTKMAFGPGIAFRFDRSMNLDQRRELLRLHSSHVHVSVWPR